MSRHAGQRGNGEFGGGGAKADNHHSNDERRYAQRTGDSLGASDETVCAPCQNVQPDGQECEGKPNWNVGIHQTWSGCDGGLVLSFLSPAFSFLEASLSKKKPITKSASTEATETPTMIRIFVCIVYFFILYRLIPLPSGAPTWNG